MNRRIKKLKDKYIEVFYKGLPEKDKEKIHLNDYLWHAYSYEAVPCIEGVEAVKEFMKKEKNDVYVFCLYNGYVEEIKDLTYEKLLKMIYWDKIYSDCYVVDKDFKWTFVYTHETEDVEKVLNHMKKSQNLYDPYYIGPFFKSLDDDYNKK